MAPSIEATLQLAQGVDTDAFAGNNLVQPQTVRKQYSIKGSYFGVVPHKLANGRLVWPNVIVTKRGVIAANDDFASPDRGAPPKADILSSRCISRQLSDRGGAA